MVVLHSWKSMPKPSPLAKVSFWAQFVSAIGAITLKDGVTKQKVIDIANGVSVSADTVQQAKDEGMINS